MKKMSASKAKCVKGGAKADTKAPSATGSKSTGSKSTKPKTLKCIFK